jgi:hypothetical protein
MSKWVEPIGTDAAALAHMFLLGSIFQQVKRLKIIVTFIEFKPPVTLRAWGAIGVYALHGQEGVECISESDLPAEHGRLMMNTYVPAGEAEYVAGRLAEWLKLYMYTGGSEE